ncbi:Protein SABRE [Tilletia horrida]|nr:Protein SABRE [Tilletia horrida]
MLRDGLPRVVTTLAFLVVVWLICRSALPRLPRVLFRGRLRIRRAGLRGVRGLEWSSKGFVSKRKGGNDRGDAQQSPVPPPLSAEDGLSESLQNQHHPDAFVVRISHIYLQFHRRDARHRSWATLHIQGVGIRLPRAPLGNAGGGKTEQGPDGARKPAGASSLAEARQRELAEREERRLQRLMVSPPTSPTLQNRATLHHRRSSLIEAVSGGKRTPRTPGAAPSVIPASPTAGRATHAEAVPQRPQLPRRPFSSLIPNTSAASFRTVPLYFGWLVYAWLRDTVFPALQSSLIKLARIGLFLLASAIPVVSSLVEVEVHRLEIYVQEAETVLRVGRLGARYSMTVVSAKHAHNRSRAHVAPAKTEDGAKAGQNLASESTSAIRDMPIQAESWSANGRTATNSQSVAQSLQTPIVTRPSRIPGVQNSLTEMLAGMPNRIGSGAMGAAAFVMAGVPAANGSLKVTFESIQVFEALFVTESGRDDLRQGSRSASKRDSFFNVPSPGLLPSNDGHGAAQSPTRTHFRPNRDELNRKSRRQPTDPFGSFDLSDSERDHDVQDLFAKHGRAHGHQRSGSSDAAMTSASPLPLSPLPTSNSGDESLYSPYQTTTARWFEAKHNKNPNQRPLAELLASPPLPGNFPASTSMQSIDSDSSDLPPDLSARLRAVNGPAPTIFQSLTAANQNLRTEPDLNLSRRNAGAQASAAKKVGFADIVPSPPPISRNASGASGGRTLKRSSSTSKLNTMNTLALSGFTDRWADWALEPIADSTFSSDSGWAFSAQGLSGDAAASRASRKTIPDSARLMSLPGLSTFRVNFVLGPSMQIRQREAVHVGVELAETNVGIEAVMKVMALVKTRQEERQRRDEAVREEMSAKDAERSSDPPGNDLQLAKKSSTFSSNAKARTALAQLGSVSVVLPRIRLAHVLRPPDHVDAFGGRGMDLRAASMSTAVTLPSNVQLEAVLRDLRFELRTSDPTDPQHQKWLGTCGISNHKSLAVNDGGSSTFPHRSDSLLSGQRAASPSSENKQLSTPPVDGGAFDAPSSPPSVVGKLMSDDEGAGESKSPTTKKTLFSPGRLGRSIRGGRRQKPVKLIEHRRAFHIEASFGALELRSAIDTDLQLQNDPRNNKSSSKSRRPSELGDSMSDLLIMRKFSVRLKSSWTPFGLLPSLRAVMAAANLKQADSAGAGADFSDPSLTVDALRGADVCSSTATLILPRPNCPFAFFASDPNEQALVAELEVDQVSSHVMVRHAAALAATLASLQSGKQAKPKSAGSSRSIALPRLAIACCARELSFRLDASDGPHANSDAAAAERQAHRSVVLAAPSIDFVFHGSYKDAYAKRNQDLRRAAWRSYQRGEAHLSPDDFLWTQRAGGDRQKGLSVSKKRSGLSPKGPGGAAEPSSSQGAQGAPATGELLDGAKDELKKVQNAQAGDDGDAHAREVLPKSTLPVPESQTETRASPSRRPSKIAYVGSIDHLFKYAIESDCRVESVEAYFGFRRERISKSRLALTVPSGSDLPPFGMSHQHVFSLHRICLHAASLVPAGTISDSDGLGLPIILPERAATELSLTLGDLAVDLWHHQALDISRDLLQTFTDAFVGAKAHAPPRRSESSTQASKKNILDALPGGLYCFSHVRSININLGGPDRRCEADLSRGISTKIDEVTFEYVASKDDRFKGHHFGSRSAISLPEDIRVNANASAVDGPAAIARLLVIGFEVVPLLDAEQANSFSIPAATGPPSARSLGERRVDSVSGHSHEHSNSVSENRPGAQFAPAVWDFQKTKHRLLGRRTTLDPPKQEDANNYIIKTNRFESNASFRQKRDTSEPVRVKLDAANDEKLLIKVEMLHTYCLLLAISSIMSLKPSIPTVHPTHGHQAAASKDKTTSKPRSMVLSVTYDIPKVDLFVALPTNIHIFVHVHRFNLAFSSQSGIEVLWETLIAAVESARVPVTDLWEEALRLRKWRIKVAPSNKKDDPANVHVSGLSASLRIPTDYQFHNVIEYSTVAFKATKQLVHQFLRNSSETIIRPVAEDAKRVPNISVRLQTFSFEAEDDPIETRLNLIWRAGSSEQRRRLEREQTFEEAAAELRSAERGKSSLSLAPSVVANFTSTEAIPDNSSATGTRQDDPASVTIDEARRRLDMFNEAEWVRRHKSAKKEQKRREEQTRSQLYGTQSLDSFNLPIRIAKPSLSAPLVRSVMTHVSIEIARPSFAYEDLPEFLFYHGSGIPKDTQYSTIIPLHLRIQLGEWRISLRDYPLPILHLPPVHPDKGNAYAWALEGDICLAEQLGGPDSIREVPALIVPASTGRKNAVEYRMQVPKMVMPLKFYGSPLIDVKTPFPTRIVWGQSLQPAIQDVQRVIESITSPPHDPSPRLPFWDKIPLLLHGRFQFKHSGNGDLHFFFKGSRDPYDVVGHGAGWVMCWRDGVELRLGFDNADREFFQVSSNEYLLAIPDLQDYLDLAASGQGTHKSDAADSKSEGPSATGSHGRYMTEPRFTKVCLRLSNGVRWGAGLIYERTCTDDTCKRRPRCHGQPFYRECRIWDRVPHWKVLTKSKQAAEKTPESLRSDSFEGWRSHHIHPSLSIFSPKEGIGGEEASERKQVNATNNLYFSPLAWEHFWRWIALFSSALTLPIRQGKLFPNTPPQSSKLSAFIATIKYRFLIEPLFISHFYQKSSKVDLARGATTLVGVKARLDSFRADLHQRQEETVKDRPELGKKLKVFHKPFNEAEVDCAGIDLRTVWARFSDPERQLLDDVDFDAEEDADDFPDTNTSEEDWLWYDIADFAELDWQPPAKLDPEISITQTMVCPRFHYYRKVESKRERRARQASLDHDYDRLHSDKTSAAEESPIDTELTPISQLAYSKFGNEHTHTCLVGTSPSAPMVQAHLAETRLSFLLAELETLTTAQRAASSRASGDDFSMATEASDRPEGDLSAEAFESRIADLKTKIKLIRDFIRSLEELHSNGMSNGAANGQMFVQSVNDRVDLRALYRDWETFHNRYFVHNPIIYFSTDTRNALLKYYLCSRMRKGFAHHMTAKAVRYVRNLRSDSPQPSSAKAQRPDGPTPGESTGFDLKGFFVEKMQFVMPDSPRPDQNGRAGSTQLLSEQPEPRRGLSDTFTINKSNVAVLLKPQVVLQANGPIQSSVIITAKRIRLQNYSVLEDRFAEDELNARLMYRNFLALDSLQCFAPTTHCQYLRTAPHRTKFAYVPLETLVDTGYQTRDFDRIISSTDARAAYDKFNRLRVNDSDKDIVPESQIHNPDFDHLVHHMDFIQVRCPRIALSADSNHFAAIYAVVTNLLLYRDPVRQDQSKRLEEMLFNYDFENLDALSEVLTQLQARVRHAKELLAQYQEHFHYLNKEGKSDLFTLNVETMEMIQDLDLLMQAITTARDHSAATDSEKKSALRLQATADELVWYMMGLQDGEQLAKLSIKSANFSWLNKADNSTSNTLSIGDLEALNIRPDAHFAEIISKYSQAGEHLMAKRRLFLLASWRVLAPVGGIAIIEDFELNMHPVRLSIELKVGREIMDYIFGSKRRQLKHEQEARITELREEQAAATVKSNVKSNVTAAKKAKRKGLFGFLGSNKSKDSGASQSRLTVPGADGDQQTARSPAHRASPTKRNGRSQSREPRPGQARRSLDEVRSRSRTRERSRHRGEKDLERGALSSDSDDGSDNDARQQRDIARRNAESMRRRASTNRTFVNVKFAETILCLSYKGDKQKSITDLFDLVFRAPTLEYRNQTCGYEDLVNFCKKDIFRAAWDQRSSLLKGILHRPRKTSRNMRDLAAQGINRITGQERSISGGRSDSLTSRSKEASSSALSVGLSGTLIDDDDEDDDEDDDDEEDEDEDDDEDDVRHHERDPSLEREAGSQLSKELGGDSSSVSIRVTDSMNESWSGQSDLSADSNSVNTPVWHSPASPSRTP